MRRPSARPWGSRISESRRRKATEILTFESLEIRSMLSADPALSNLVEVAQAASAASAGGYTPAEIRSAYGFNNISFGSTTANGAGETIAIVDAYNDPNIASDLATFDAQFGIAAANLKVVNQSGGSNLPGTDPSGGWELEEALDVEWAHAIAPAANIVLVEANSDSDSDLFAAVNYARNLSSVSVISMSWGSDDSASDASSEEQLSSEYLATPSGHQGITFVAAAGDTGVAEFPSTSPNVLAVGGTDLYLNSNNTISSETYWYPQTVGGTTYSGGGGVSKVFSGRVVPDVSYDAGESYDVYDSFTGGGGWVAVGGTSAGSPQWAALVAIADQGRAADGEASLNGSTQTVSALHAAPSSDYNTITGGTQETTGLGSPKANLIVPYLVSYGGTTTTTTTAPAAPSSISAEANSSTSVTIDWSSSSGETGYELYELENGQAVLIGTYSAGTNSATINGLSPNTPYSFQVAAYNSAGSNATGWTQVTTLAASSALSAPQNFKVSAASSTTASLSWQSVSGATGYAIYQWNGSSAVLLGRVAASTTSVTVTGLTPGSTDYFSVTAYNATSSASTSEVSVIMPTGSTSTSTLTAPVLTAKALSSTTGQLTWTSSSGATGYEIYYMNGGSAVPLGSVSANTTSVRISNMAPGTTYEFMVVAYNRTSQADSQWTSLTTSSSSARAALAGGDDLSAAGESVTFDLSASGESVGSLGSTISAGAFANASSAASNGLTLSWFSGGAFLQAAGSAAQAATNSVGQFSGSESVSIDDAVVAESSSDPNSTLSGDALVDIALARRDYGSSSTAGGALTAVAEGTQTDRELTLYRHNLIESLDSLFGRDVEWAGGSAASQGTATSSDQFDREAGAVSLTERPSAAMLAVGLAISALWTEVEASDTVDRKAKTRESLLRRRRVAP